MAHGIKAEGEGGRLLIDPSYSTYTLVSSGTLALTHEAGDLYSGTLSVSSGYTNPIILFRPPVGRAISYWGRRVISYGTSSTSVSYAILVPTSSVADSSETHGIRVWDSGGRRVFDSGHSIVNTINTYTYAGTAEPTISAGYNDWLMVTTWGVTRFADGTTSGGNLAMGLCIYLEKHNDGNLSSHTLPSGILGPGNLAGQRIALNSIYVNRCEIQ